MRTDDVVFDPATAGPTDEARLRRAMLDLGFCGSEIEDEIARAKRLRTRVHVFGHVKTPSHYVRALLLAVVATLGCGEAAAPDRIMDAQESAEWEYRGGATFCEAHPEVPFCTETI